MAQINRAELQAALELVRPGLANKETIEQATSFAFMSGRVVTYNDEISVSHPVDGLDIDGAIQAEELYKLLSKMKGEIIEIEVNGGEVLITSGKSKAGLTMSEEVTLPLEEIGETGKFKRLPESFLKHLSFAVSSCSTNSAKPILGCVNIRKDGIVEASDGYKISYCTMEKELAVNTFLLPSGSIKEVIKLKPRSISEGKGWIHFKTETGTVLSCRTMEGDSFPNVKRFLDIEGVQFSFPKDIKEILDKASIFKKGETLFEEVVQVTLQKGKIVFRSESEVGWFEEETPIKYSGSTLTFKIALYILREILNHTKECIVGETMIKFEGEDWIYAGLLSKN